MPPIRYRVGGYRIESLCSLGGPKTKICRQMMPPRQKAQLGHDAVLTNSPARNFEGVVPLQRLNARVNALTSE